MKAPKSPEEVEVEAVFGFHAELSEKHIFHSEERSLCFYPFPRITGFNNFDLSFRRVSALGSLKRFHHKVLSGLEQNQL